MAKLRAAMGPATEGAALERLQSYVADELRGYEKHRHRADRFGDANANSGLSPFLRWGQLSPRQLYWAVADAGLPKKAQNTFARRVFWRDHACASEVSTERFLDVHS